MTVTVYNVFSEQVIFVGDLHGNFDTFLYWLKNFVPKNRAIVVCGDVGFGFHRPKYYNVKLEAINKFCEENDCTVFFIRGNHDDPQYFNGGNGDKTSFVTFEHVHAVKDYSCIHVWKENKVVHNILCVGGGISIDRMLRMKQDINNAGLYARHAGLTLKEAVEKLNPTYWKDEPPTYDDEAMGLVKAEGTSVDVVCTHTCPSFVGLNDKEGLKVWMDGDPDLEGDLNHEREVMDEIWKRLKEDGHTVTTWVYGHFHRHMYEEHDGVKFVMLDMCRTSTNKIDSFDLDGYGLQ